MRQLHGSPHRLSQRALPALLFLSSLMIIAGCAAAGAGGGAADEGDVAPDDSSGSDSGSGGRPELKELAADVRDGKESAWPHNLLGYGDALYFVADDGQHGHELWKHDGDAAVRVSDISPGADDADPTALIVYDNALYFEASDGPGSTGMYRFAGGATENVYDSLSGDHPERFLDPAVLGSVLMFSGQADEAAGGWELYRYDGAGIALAADITDLAGAPASEHSMPDHLSASGDVLYFSARGTQDQGRELWMYTPADGATLAAHVEGFEDPNESYPKELDPRYMTTFENKLYFACTLQDARFEDWELCSLNPNLPPELGAQLVGVVNHTGDGAVKELTVYDGALYFSGGEGPFAPDRYLYRYDGLTVTKLDDIVTDDGSGYLPGNLTVYDGELYFMATESEHGRELWRFDGERAELVWDILPGAESSSAYSLQVHDEALYLAALSPDAGVELHSYQSPKP